MVEKWRALTGRERRLLLAAVIFLVPEVLLRFVPGMRFSAILCLCAAAVLVVLSVLEHGAARGSRAAVWGRRVLLALLAAGFVFFAVLEDIHTEVYGVAEQALRENGESAPAERAAKAILASCRKLSDTGAMRFVESDAEFLLHRLPQEIKSAHYHDDEVHIRALLEKSGLRPKGGMALAAATIRGLILTVSHQEQIGRLYPQVLETLVYGACRELFG